MTSPSPTASWGIPAPLKRLFDTFPLVTYTENDLPTRSVTVPGRGARSDIHAFYDAHEGKKSSIGGQGDALHAFFSWTEAEGETGPMVASFNPGCLKWQVSSSYFL
jgi:metaxin